MTIQELTRDVRDPFILSCIGIQIVSAVVLAFGGVSLDLALLIVLTFGCSFLLSTILAATQGRWKLVLAQILAPILFCALIYALTVGWSFSFLTDLDAKDFQHLKGMTQAEAHHALGNRTPKSIEKLPVIKGGFQTYEQYNGIVIVYDPGDRVIAIVAE